MLEIVLAYSHSARAVMRVPNRDHAYVPERKLTGYLLSRSHPVGTSKARFFRGLGFDESNVE